MTAQLQSAGDVALAVATRAGLAENVHRGRYCVISADDGTVVASGGDIDALTFVRSTAKPLQAIASLLEGIESEFGWTSRHLALMAASHRGHPVQIEALEQMLATSGVPEEAYAFHPTKPIDSGPREAWARAGLPPRKIYHTCAGKHAGMLALCRLKGWPLEGYTEPDHPAQQEILRRVLEWTGTDEADYRIGRDGCGVPVAALPLHRIALGYARLACPDVMPDQRASDAVLRITAAMNSHPEMVEGPGRLASLLLSDPNIVAKSGAQGLFTIGLRKERLGIAVHVSDGSETAWPFIVMDLLRRFGGASGETMQRLEARFPAEFRNDAGALAGNWQVCLD
jgi:L-asparaginase II